MVDMDVSSISSAVSTAGNELVAQTILFVPNLILALAYLILGYIVADIVGKVLNRLLDHLKIEDAFKKFGIEDALGGTHVSPILAALARWYVVLLFLQAAIFALNMATLTKFIQTVLDFMPAVFGAILLVIAAAIVGEWVREGILRLKKFYLQYTLAQATKMVIIIMAVVVGLETVGFRMEFVREVLTLLMAGLTNAFAIAFGLAFGLGGQKDASDLIKKVRKSLGV